MAKKSRRIITVPASLAEANTSLFRVGAIDRSVSAIENGLSEAIARLREEAEAGSAPLLSERDDLATGLKLFAEANRATLLENDRKSVRISAGVFGWRWTPTKVQFLRGGAKKVLEAIKELKLKKYLRVKESVDKEALLKDRPEIPGVKYVQSEEFFFEPASETVTEPVADNVAVFAKAA